MRIYRYLMEHKAAFLIVVLCFVVQACCELALPKYTSNIVDVGIQQSGIENPSPEVLSADTYGVVTMLAPADDEATIRASYDFDVDAGYYVLNAEGKAYRSVLDDAISLPLVCSYYSQSIPDFDIAALRQAYEAGQVTKADIEQGLDQVLSSAGLDNDSLLSQQATLAAKAEYDACGVSTADIQMDYLLHVGKIMIALAAIALIVHCIMNFFCCRNATKIGRDLRSRFFKRVVDFSDAEVDTFSAASLITRGTNDIQQIQMVCMMAQRMVVYTVVISIGAIIMVAQTNVSMSWIIGLAIVAIALVIGILFAVTMPKFKKMQALIDKVNEVSREILTGLPVIRAFGREDFELERFQTANSNLMGTQLFTNRAMAFLMPTMMLVMNLVSVAIVWVGGHYVDLGTVQTGDLIAFITYSMIIVMSFLMIGVIAVVFPRANVAAQRVDEVINTASSIQDALEVYDAQLFEAAGVAPGATSAQGATSVHAGPEAVRGNGAAKSAEEAVTGAEIRFNDVCFRYADGCENVLDHVSFCAPAGKTTAIIGSTGSGKSTIIRLIERFYDVNEGSIELDGIDIRHLSQKALRSTFGYVPQKAFLFSGTIESNVGYGVDGLTPARRDQALSIAQAADFVAEKPEGVLEPIAQGGTNVSGGQRQRLAIARALATNARAYLFDDSFSALDYKTDAKLRHDLQTQLAGRTVIIVAQRISTIMNADTIIVLDEGRVVGQGTHEQLLEGCETY
ncbi:MAG: ABC transporter ATP-binding protein, partial [Phoenicibacter congonensis]|nr:ABC transporter ATP-binding protein [Phoenicibacter congonensis]